MKATGNTVFKNLESQFQNNYSLVRHPLFVIADENAPAPPNAKLGFKPLE